MILTIFNIAFFAYISRVLGGLYTKPNTNENLVPRWLSLTACFVVIAINTYPDIVSLVAWCLAFYVIRIQSTQPLLDATYEGFTNFKPAILRNLWLIPLAPFTSWWILLLVPQVFIYYFAGKLARRYSWVKAVTLIEVLTGAIIGAMI